MLRQGTRPAAGASRHLATHRPAANAQSASRPHLIAPSPASVQGMRRAAELTRAHPAPGPADCPTCADGAGAGLRRGARGGVRPADQELVAGRAGATTPGRGRGPVHRSKHHGRRCSWAAFCCRRLTRTSPCPTGRRRRRRPPLPRSPGPSSAGGPDLRVDQGQGLFPHRSIGARATDRARTPASRAGRTAGGPPAAGASVPGCHRPTAQPRSLRRRLVEAGERADSRPSARPGPSARFAFCDEPEGDVGTGPPWARCPVTPVAGRPAAPRLGPRLPGRGPVRRRAAGRRRLAGARSRSATRRAVIR